MNQRRGRFLSLPGESATALNLRRHREAQRLSLRALAQRSGVGQFLIVDFEHSRRTPTPDQHRKLLAALGVTDADRFPAGLTEEALTALSACLAWTHETPLDMLARALGLTTAEARDGIERSRERLRTIGLEVFVDHRRVRVLPVSWCERPLRTIADTPHVAATDIPVLVLLYKGDGAKLRDLETTFGGALRGTLDSLAARGLVGYASGGRVADRKYWITQQGFLGAAKWALNGRARAKKLRTLVEP